jgi:hypothetical protein
LTTSRGDAKAPESRSQSPDADAVSVVRFLRGVSGSEGARRRVGSRTYSPPLDRGPRRRVRVGGHQVHMIWSWRTPWSWQLPPNQAFTVSGLGWSVSRRRRLRVSRTAVCAEPLNKSTEHGWNRMERFLAVPF